MINVGIVVLIGSGDDVDVKLVSADTMQWIRTEEALLPQIQIDSQEDNIRDGFLEAAKNWNGSSPENDRALMANSEYGGNLSWSSIIDALNYAKKHDLNICDSFEGYIY